MIFQLIASDRRNKHPVARGRRSVHALPHVIEWLENRTPMSAGLGTAIAAIVSLKTAEIRSFTQESLATGGAAIATRDSDWGMSSGAGSQGSETPLPGALENDQGEFPMIPPPPGATMGPAPSRSSGPTAASTDESNMTYSGALEPILASTDPTEISDSSPAVDHTSNPIVAGRSVQLDASGEVNSAGGLSYVAAGTSSAFCDSSAADETLLAWEEGTAEPLLPGSITTGGLSLSVFLDGAHVSTPGPVGVEPVVELVPLPESSLALAATLWAVSPDDSASMPGWHLAVARATEPNMHAAAVSSWMLFMTGVDQALEQTCRDLQETIVSASPARRPARFELSGRAARMARAHSACRRPRLAENGSDDPGHRGSRAGGPCRGSIDGNPPGRSTRGGRRTARRPRGGSNNLGRVDFHGDHRLVLAETPTRRADPAAGRRLLKTPRHPAVATRLCFGRSFQLFDFILEQFLEAVFGHEDRCDRHVEQP